MNIILKNIRIYNTIFSISVLLTAFLFNPSYTTNDDPFFIYSFSGTYFFDGHPFENTVHVSKLLGYLMVWLYSRFGFLHIEYYTYFLYFILFCVSLCLNNLFFDKGKDGEKSNRILIFRIGFIILFLFNFFIQLQFTIITIICTVTSYFCIKKNYTFYTWQAFCLLILAELLRYRIVPYILVIMLLGDFFLNFKKKQHLLYVFQPKVFLFLIISAILTTLHEVTYTKDEKQFASFVSFASSVVDNNVNPSWYTNKNNHLLALPDYDEVETTLMKEFFFSDSNLYSAKEDYNSFTINNQFNKIDYYHNFNIYYKWLINNIKSFTYLKVLLFLCCLNIFLSSDWNRFWGLLISNSFFYLIVLLITLFLRLPPFHLEYPLFIGLNLLYLYNHKYHYLSTINTLNKTKYRILAMVILLLSTLSLYNMFKFKEKKEPYNYDMLLNQSSLDSSIIYIIEPAISLIVNPFKKSDNSLKNIITWSVWSNHPNIRRRLINGIQLKDLTLAVMQNPKKIHFLLEQNYAPLFCKIYRSFILKRYKIDCEFVYCRSIESHNEYYLKIKQK